MRAFRDAWLMTLREIRHLLRQPVWIVVNLSTPLLLLGLFSPLLGPLSSSLGFQGNVLQGFLPGILLLIAFAGGLNLGWGVVSDLERGVIERFRVTPISRVAMLLGPILANILSNWVFGALLVVAGTVFGFQIYWGGMLLLFLLLGLTALLFGAFSIAVALLTRITDSFAAVVNGVNLPILLLGGILLPISLGPHWMTALAHLDPLYYSVQASRILALGEVNGVVGEAFAITSGLGAIALGWATWVLRRQVS
jgi:ABC-2 type transport system permease protein